MRIRGAVLEEIGRARPYSESHPITVSELELDAPGPGEVLVRIEAAGLCHSDLSVVDGNRVRPVPMLLGHEAAGIIEELGPLAPGAERAGPIDAAADSLAVGDRVVMAFLPRCGECANCRTDGQLPCTPGSVANNAGELLGGGRRLSRDGEAVQHHLGVSGFATHAVVDARSVTRVDGDVPPDIAAVLGCAVLTGGGAVLNAGAPSNGDDVIVIGLGGVGMAAVLTALSLKADGAVGRVIGVDAQAAKLDQVRELGADAAYTPEDLAAEGVRAPVVIEAAGHPKAFEAAVAATAVGGKTVTVGLPNPAARSEISPLVLTAEARTIIGSYLGSAVPQRDIPRYVDMWRAGRLPVEKLISGVIALDQINEGMDALADGTAVRQVIRF
ncbi:alcohol dehydrogenase catalytic domain-containing protein [Tsukamurella strandjordii]|uniref:Alcohol dehydrogenase catalytic domain-containing protein n=1 Tax=Tsukamurella strandjordii TaxID=147577 RepID=A0AA90SLI0_9ACTN|nr:alcohol dehydrogenase catalytic domain-containing protein [Tsukamurella strandjordii]MDP0398123.1 alcohol dehydrogenase catalytic domain-containing protein [Tsukamurella strandjordii]